MDASRLRQGEIVAGIGGVALFIFLFFDWYGSDGEISFNGWDTLGGDISGLLVFLAAIAGVKLAGLAAMGLRLNVPFRRGTITFVLGYLATAIIVWRAFTTPESVGLEFGFFLGLAAALAIAIGAMLALREAGFNPVVATTEGATNESSGATE